MELLFFVWQRSRPSRTKKGANKWINETIVVREVGGALAPLWSSYIEPGAFQLESSWLLVAWLHEKMNSKGLPQF